MSAPPILPGCDVLPPMRPATNGKAGSTNDNATKGKGTDKAKRKSGDRFRLLNAFVDFTAAGLPRAETLVWLILFRDTKPDGLARTSQADLARRAGANLRTVKRAVAQLERRGLLKVVRRGGLRQGPSTYRVKSLEPPGGR
ncbi:MAG TPA: helix-turn-helix domain-containing protein [Pirellulales bacterium]|nr:helix-turn-helix domain-containing protein [Pirellulales bacterium]